MRPMEDDALEVEKRASARVGTEVKGKWKVDRLLGLGGMAAVYAATHRNGKRVALKILHREVSAVPDLRARFLREAKASNRVDHPGVVSVSDDDVTEDGAAFLVMDLLEGETVGARWAAQGKRFDIRSVLEIADQLLDVLVVAHEGGIVHRDIKPDNLFMVRGSGLKVLDFGIARVRELSSVTKGATYAGAVMGTPAFMPPEQARSRWADVDAQSDVWAVGATMFTLLSGRFVHDAETPNEQLAQAITRPAPALIKVAPNAPADIAAIVDRALMYEKRDRFRSAAEMQKAVRVALGALDRALPAVFATAPTIAAISGPSADSLLTSETASGGAPAVRLRAIAIGGVIAAAAIGVAVVISRGGAGTAPATEPATAEVSAPAQADRGDAPPLGTVTSDPPAEATASASGTAISVDALPDATARDKPGGAAASAHPTTPSPPSTSTEPNGTKTKKRRNLGF
jgi:serine/threonine-protein kinase